MAKDPTDRFQTAAEVTAALVAGPASAVAAVLVAAGTVGDDEFEFRLTATNPTRTDSVVEWATPCVQIDKFTGTTILTNTAVTGEGLTHLKDLTGPVELWLNGTRVPRATIMASPGSSENLGIAFRSTGSSPIFRVKPSAVFAETPLASSACVILQAHGRKRASRTGAAAEA